MTHLSLFAVPLLAVGLAATAHAGERPDHFKGEQARTLDEALAHLSDYNARLAAILAKGELGPEDTAEIHQLTYTLENALETLDDGIDGLKETLERVHVASERFEVDVVKAEGRRYLDTAAKIAP